MTVPRFDLDLDEILAGSVAFALPLRSRFRGIALREGLLIQGPSGWGEFAPFDDYSDARAARWLAAAIEAAFGKWPDPIRETVEVNAIIPDVEATRAGQLAREAIRESGTDTIKVKVGGDLAEDEARVAAIRDALEVEGVDGSIRLDANARWSLPQAQEALSRLARYGIEYVEQPCALLEDIARLREETTVPIAVDEGIRLADDPAGVRLAGIADYAIYKPLPLGGVAATLNAAANIDVPVVLSGSLDSAVGLSTCLAAAGALPELNLACGFGTGALLAADVVETPLRPREGRLNVERFAPDPAALAAAQDYLPAGRVQWWRERATRAYASMQG